MSDFMSGFADGIADDKGLRKGLQNIVLGDYIKADAMRKGQLAGSQQYRYTAAGDLDAIRAREEGYSHQNRLGAAQKMNDPNLSERDRLYYRGIHDSTAKNSADHLANSMKIFQNVIGIDGVMNGSVDAGRFGKANAAAQGKDLYGNANWDGGSLDKFTGEQFFGNAPVAKSHLGLVRAQTNNQNASAGQHSASAGLARQKTEDLRNDVPNPKNLEKSIQRFAVGVLRDPFTEADKKEAQINEGIRILKNMNSPTKTEKEPSIEDEYKAERQRAISAGRYDLVRQMDQEAKRMGIIK